MDSPTAPNEDEQMRESLERLELMKKCGRFRVLVVGRANAGKTTICQRMCRTTEPPTIRNVQGNVIDVSPTAGRGEHNIEDEITYEKNSGYVFHDSRGLEAGSSAEKQTLLEFIASRAEKGNLRDQLHAIWFCVPVDDDRPLIEAEQEFFTKERSLVPVILVFTKCEAQQSRHYKGSGDASAEQEKQLLQEALNNANMYLDELASRVRNSPHPPDAIVNIREMHKAKKSPRHCDALLESTGKCLQNDVLKNLLSCVQKNNLNLCIKWAIDDYGLRKKWLDKSFDQNNIYRFLLWFPFHEVLEDRDSLEREKLEVGALRFKRVGRVFGFAGAAAAAIVQEIVPRRVSQEGGVRVFVDVIVVMICAEHIYWGTEDGIENVARRCIDQRLDAILASDFSALISKTNSPNDKSEWVFNIVLQNLLPRPTQN